MSYTINKSKQYTVDADTLYAALLRAIVTLEGKVLKQDATQRSAEVRFHKTILGKVLGDRTFLSVQIEPSENGSTLNTTIYPLDAVGRKLMFGARKGVSATVLSWVHAHIDHQLKVAA